MMPGKDFQAYWAAITLALIAGSGAAQAQPGSVVPSSVHGHAGKAFVDFGSANDYGFGSALQPDGKLVQVGRCPGMDDADFCIVRLDRSLRLDPSFVGPTGLAGGQFILRIGAGDDGARAVAIQPDGKIVVLGTCQLDPENDPNKYVFCLARLLANGALDPSFDGPSGNGNGLFLLPIGLHNDSAAALAVQPDGKIVVLGTCIDDTNSEYVFCLARLNENGSLDTNFDGPQVTPGNGKFLLPITPFIGQSDTAYTLALQADGKILVAGDCNNGTDRDFCVARLTANGAWDSSFVGPSNSANGRFLLPISITGTRNDYAHTMLLQPDGKIVLAGQCRGSTYDEFCLARLNADGSLDPDFVQPNGSEEGKFQFPVGSGNATARAVTIQLDGKLLIAGTCVNASANFLFCAVRLHADGAFDATFDGDDGLNPGNGRVLIDMSVNTDALWGVHLRPGGTMVLAGYCDSASATDFCSVELEGGAFGAMQCSLDIDGSGSTDATVDGLVAMRIALGFSGSAVTAGINFPATASRNTWSAIRLYLASQCGLNLPH